MAGLTKAQRAEKAAKIAAEVEVADLPAEGSDALQAVDAENEQTVEVVDNTPKKYRYEFNSYEEYNKYTGNKG